MSSWSNEVVSAVVIQSGGSFQGLFIYSGPPAAGNLIGSWSSVAGVDPFGNVYPAGLNANQGQLFGALLSNCTLTGPQILNAIMSLPMVTNPTVTGGTMTQTVITFTSSGGQLFAYATSTTTATITSGSTWTAPAGNYTSGKVEVWGPGSGADGGSATQGGVSGGSGSYAQEPNYPLTPGQVYQIQIGQGGTGGTTGNGGQSGSGPTTFDNGAIVGNPGSSASSGGQGGAASSNTIAVAGTNGTIVGGNTGGCGGPGSPGSSGQGGAGGAPSGATGGAAGTAGAGGGAAGGAGGNAGANGANGSAPGAAGGGAGAASGVTQGTKTYLMTASASYYGSDATNGNPNGQRTNSHNGNGTMYQGGETASGGSANGTQKALTLLPSSVQSDLAGVTIDSVTIRLEWLHTWYNSGGDVAFGYNNRTSLPTTWNGADITSVATWFQGSVGSPVTTDLSSTGLGAALQSGAAKALTVGPGPGSISNPNLNYYGYFYGGGGGDPNQQPLLTVNYHTGAAPKTAGSGANGQIKVTYSSSTTLNLSISAAAGTDSFGNSFPAGIAAIQHGTDYASLNPNGTNAALGFGAAGGAVDTSLWRASSGLVRVPSVRVDGALFGDVANSLLVVANPMVYSTSGSDAFFSGIPVLSRSGTTTKTVTGTSSTQITDSYSLPASDANVGTTYRFKTWGIATWEGNSLIVAWFGQQMHLPFGLFAAGDIVHVDVEWNQIVTNAGSSGTYNITGRIVASNTAFSKQGVGSLVVNGGSQNWTVAQTIFMSALWGGTVAGQTISFYGSTFERLGA